jgi:hypothetical protein
MSVVRVVLHEGGGNALLLIRIRLDHQRSHVSLSVALGAPHFHAPRFSFDAGILGLGHLYWNLDVPIDSDSIPGPGLVATAACCGWTGCTSERAR